MNRLITTLILLGVVGASIPASAEQISYNVLYKYDVDSTTETFCVLEGANGTPFGPGIQSIGNVTAANDPTLTAVDATQDVFAELAVGDVLVFNNPTAVVRLETKTSADAVEMSEAQTITAKPFQWYKLVCGTAATSGWFDVSNFDGGVVITVQSEQQVDDGNGIDVRWQCRGSSFGQAPIQVYPDNSSAAAVTNFAQGNTATTEGRVALYIPEPWSECRVGLDMNTADDGDDATTNLEEFTISLTGRRNQ